MIYNSMTNEVITEQLRANITSEISLKENLTVMNKLKPLNLVILRQGRKQGSCIVSEVQHKKILVRLLSNSAKKYLT